MRKYTLLTSVLLTAPFAAGNVLAQCVATQDCATLGYTETSCQNGGIKCPFGNYWACKNDGTTDCTYGTIYFSDGSCGEQLIKGKTAIGVVAYDENNEKWIIAMENAKTGLRWSEEYVDIPGITNYASEDTAITDFKSCENTEAMLARGEYNYYSAAAAKNYAPAGAENTKGKWCLPAAGILQMVTNHKTEIDEALSRAVGERLNTGFWSSTMRNSYYAYDWSFSQGVSVVSKQVTQPVRPIMKI